ncbi:AEC family transporter [Candidatus Omnitrophota bacterium]
MFFKLMFTTFHGIMEVFLIGIVVYLIMTRLSEGSSYMDFLSKLVVRVTLPCLVFSNLVKNFETGEVRYWWAFPLLAVTINIVGTLIAGGYVLLDRKVEHRGEFMALSAFQNGTFLPLAFAHVLFGPEKLPVFLNVFFLYCLLQIPAFFTIAVWLLNMKTDKKQRINSLLNPPNIATVIGLLVVVIGYAQHVPDIILRPITAIGSITPILATFFVGGIIVANLLKARPSDWGEPIKSTFIKCLVCPAIGSFVVYILRPPEFIALFIIMQSAMPSAILIALVMPQNKTKQQLVAAGILLSSLACIVTLPLFMGIYGALYW